MSASSVPNAGSFSFSLKSGAVKAPSKATSNWVGTSLLTARAMAAGVGILPFPYVKGIFKTAVIVLETVEVCHWDLLFLGKMPLTLAAIENQEESGGPERAV